MNRKMRLNEQIRYYPKTKNNVESWKNILWLFWTWYPKNGVMFEDMLVYSVKDHTKGGQGFINYCLKRKYLLEVK